MTGMAQPRQPGPVAREIRRLIPPTLFFLVAFNLLALTGELAEAGFSWVHFALIQLWLGVLFLNYCAIGELMRALGRGRVLRLFFGPVTPADFAPEAAREGRHG